MGTLKYMLCEICRENRNTHFMFSDFLFRKLRSLWVNVEKCGGASGTTNDVIWVACWIRKATCTHKHAHSHAAGRARNCTTVQFLLLFHTTMTRERNSLLRYAYISHFVYILITSFTFIYSILYIGYLILLQILNTHWRNFSLKTWDVTT
jgi:hypothetical protein